MIEQIHIPFAPQLAGSVDISNQIAESNFVTWVSKHWQWIIGGIIVFVFLAWVLGGFDKTPEPIVKEKPKPQPTPNPNALPLSKA